MDILRAIGGLFPRRAEDQPRRDDDDFWYEEAANQSIAGVKVTPDIALKASALFTCVKILAEIVGTLPLRMKRDVAGGTMDVPDHPLEEILRYQPNARNTAIEFWEMMILHAALRGCAYAEIVPGARGAVDQLLPLHTDRVRPECMRDGTLRFHVTNPHTGQSRVLLQEEMFRVPGLSSDGITGLRAVDLAADDIGLGIAADHYAGRVFSNKLNIGGFLIHPRKMDPSSQKRLIHALMEKFAGPDNAHRPILLQDGIKFERASMDAKDAQLLEARKWQIITIAMRFRIPLHMLGIYDGVTRSNVEQQAIDLVKYTIRPWVRRIEQAIRRDLIVAKGTYFAEFNLEGLLRGDSTARAEYFSKALGSGGSRPWMTQNEVRRIEGLNALPGGDDITPTTAVQTAAVDAGEEDTSEAAARALIGRENAAIRKAAMRLAGQPDAFRDWAKSFYGGHVSTVMSLLGVEKVVARAYCDHQRGELLAANDIEGLLQRREDSAPAEIARILKGKP